MKKFVFVLTAAFGLLLFTPAPKADAQITFGINIGPAPVCPYGYYGYAPYRCAPYGYYGPEWFNGGNFIGAGRWYRGPAGFNGHVNRQYDPRYGYHGGYPEHGGYREPPTHFNDFHPSHNADPRGRYHGPVRGNDGHGGRDDHGHGH